MIFKTGLCKTRRTKISERSYDKKTGTEFESYDMFNDLHVFRRNIVYNEIIFKTGLCKTRRTKISERSYHQKTGGGWRRVSAASNNKGVLILSTSTCIVSSREKRVQCRRVMPRYYHIKFKPVFLKRGLGKVSFR
jgi:hypothetical protein